MKGMMIGVTGPGGAAENMLRIILNKGRLKLTDVTSVGSGVGFDRHRGDGDGQDPGHRPCRSGLIMRLTVDGFILPRNSKTPISRCWIPAG
jgi:hypothetical protein